MGNGDSVFQEVRHNSLYSSLSLCKTLGTHLTRGGNNGLCGFAPAEGEGKEQLLLPLYRKHGYFGSVLIQTVV